MARGDKSKYTDRQKRKAEHIEEGYLRRGASRQRAARIGWATVNKEEGGGNKGFPAFFAEVGAFCMGATTYQWVLDNDELVGSPDKWHGYYGDTPCWVFTHRDLPVIPGANLRFVSGDQN